MFSTMISRRHWNSLTGAGLIAVCVMLWGLASPAPAARAQDDIDKIAGLEALRSQDLRVATIAFRLVTAGLDLCDRHSSQLGFVLHDANQYSASLRDLAARHFGFREGPSISAIVPGGPASAAGLQADDALVAINGIKLATTEGGGGRASYDGMARVMGVIDRALAQGPLVLMVRRGDRTFDAKVTPVPACASEVQLIPSGRMNALADGRYVQVTSAIVDFVASDDELAVVIGHELAHNILGHRAKLDVAGVGSGLSSKFGKKAARIRATEIEADRLGLRLVARAGYDVQAAPAFWRRFGKEHGQGIFADATHPGWRDRAAMLQQVIAELRGSN